jgi:hypothetical protein
MDTFAPIGPAIVTKDAIPDVCNLRLRCLVNDQVLYFSTALASLYCRHELLDLPSPPLYSSVDVCLLLQSLLLISWTLCDADFR